MYIVNSFTMTGIEEMQYRIGTKRSIFSLYWLPLHDLSESGFHVLTGNSNISDVGPKIGVLVILLSTSRENSPLFGDQSADFPRISLKPLI